MSLSESKRKANDKYIRSHYERIFIAYPKGTRDLWKQFASDRGLSLAEFVKRAVEAYVKEDSKNECF